MKQIILSAAFAFVALTSAAAAAERKAEIAVSALTCPSCVFIVATSLEGVPSVKIDAFVEALEAGHGVYSVTYDDAETNVEGLIAAVTANGYPAQLLPETKS